jgi:hypothetical protein
MEGELLLAPGRVVERLCGQLVDPEQATASLDHVLCGVRRLDSTGHRPRPPCPKIEQEIPTYQRRLFVT